MKGRKLAEQREKRERELREDGREGGKRLWKFVKRRLEEVNGEGGGGDEGGQEEELREYIQGVWGEGGWDGEGRAQEREEEEGDRFFMREITEEELDRGIGKLKNGKAVGEDEIPGEGVKGLGNGTKESFEWFVEEGGRGTRRVEEGEG